MIAITVERAWLDAGNKVGYAIGLFVPSDNYIHGGDPADFSLHIPGVGYNKLIHLETSGCAPYSYFSMSCPASQVSGPFGRVRFFSGYGEIVHAADVQAPYPDEIKAATWRFFAIFEKP